MAGLFAAAFGDQRLYLSDLDTEAGREKAIHRPTRGDSATIQDRGKRYGAIRCEIVFCEVDGEAPYLDRYHAFRALQDDPTPRIFVHPLRGAIRCELGECREVAGADTDAIRVSAEFHPVAEPVAAVTSVGGGIAAVSGPETVEVAAAAADAALAALEVESDLPAACAAAATAWAEADEVNSRSVYVEVASLADKIDALVEELELASDLTRWEAYRALVLLLGSLRNAAVSVASASTRTFDLIVDVSTPLRVLCARVVGASGAEAYAARVARDNDLRSTLLVPAGTVLKMPVVGGGQ